MLNDIIAFSPFFYDILQTKQLLINQENNWPINQ